MQKELGTLSPSNRGLAARYHCLLQEMATQLNKISSKYNKSSSHNHHDCIFLLKFITHPLRSIRELSLIFQ